MRELSGLKVRALACDAPEGLNFHISGTNYLYGDPEHERHLVSAVILLAVLPPGNWTILGRADELKVHQIFALEVSIHSNPTLIMAEWDSYRAANNITNQLILIPQ